MFVKRFQLGLIHTAVAMTLVPINSTLNRVMIKELAVSATLVAVLASLPYLFSPIQVAIGSFSDRHPLFGWRRSPYILLGLLLCVFGVVLAPEAAFLLGERSLAGLGLAALAFGAWGMGYNLAAVCYLSLASELSGEAGRSRTIAVMWFMMIVGIILTAVGLSYLVDPYTAGALKRAFWIVGLGALVLGLLGLVRLEPRSAEIKSKGDELSWLAMARVIKGNPQAAFFFWYLIILLAALLGQDILLEPYGGEAFGMTVRETTRITSLWGGMVLLAFIVAGALDGKLAKKTVARLGGWSAVIGFGLIAISGFLSNLGLFYSGIVLLGFGTGLSTVSNLGIMLDMTIAGSVGLFIGVWGMASAISRLMGSVLGGAVRDVITQISQSPLAGYIVVFASEGCFLLVSLIMLRKVNVLAFHEDSGDGPSMMEKTAIAGDV